MRSFDFAPLYRSSVGFDQIANMMDRVLKSDGTQPSYPPYNIEQTASNGLRISLAVAGFTMDDLSVTIEDNQLMVRGKNTQDDSDRIYIHRGIAARQFQRSFVLAEGVEVTAARLEKGLLHVDLVLPIPETQVRQIPIEDMEKPAPAANTKTIDVKPE